MIELLAHLDEVQLADPTGGLLIALGMALLARLLYKKRDQQPLRDDKPTTATQRGAFLPLVIGTRQVGAVVLWVGDREIVVEEEPAGGKGGSGGDTVKKSIYYESAVHGVSVGPASYIRGIYSDGGLIPGSTEINSRNTPSGTLVDFGPDHGKARFFWGERTQPYSTLFTSKLGINTRAPYSVRIEWEPKRLGQTPNWPIIEYVVGTPPMQGSNVVGEPVIGSGVNVGEAVWQLATAPFPHGAGTPTTWWDYDQFAALGALAENENIGVNLLVQDGDPADKIIAELMQDFGFLLPECDGVLSPFPIRQFTGEVPLLDDDILLPTVEEIDRVHKSRLGDALVYEYADEERKYRTATIDVDDDSLSSIRNQRKVKKISVPSATSRSVVSKIVGRRQIEDLDKPLRAKLKATRGLRYVQPGQPLDLPGVGRVRVLSTLPDMNGPAIELDLVRDMFDQETLDYSDPDLPGGTPAGELEDHENFEPVELPLLASDQISVAIPHIRANNSVFASNLWASADGLSYTRVGVQSSPATGGILAEDFSVHNRVLLYENGPLVTTSDSTSDRDDIPQNLESLPDSWVSGAQLLLIIDGETGDSELLYIRDFVQESGDNYRAKGCFVSRLMSRTAVWVGGGFAPQIQKTYPAGSEVYVMPAASLSPARGSIISTGGARHFKAQAVNASGGFPLGAVVPVERPLKSLALTTPDIPWAVCGGSHNANTRVGSRRDGMFVNGVSPNDDLLVDWKWLDRAGGAGQTGFGNATPTNPPLDAQFEIKIRFGDAFFVLNYINEALDVINETTDPGAYPVVATYLLNAIDVWDADRQIFRWTYTHAQRVADGVADMNYNFASDDLPTFGGFEHLGQIEIRQVQAGVKSPHPYRLRPIAVSGNQIFGP